MEIRLATIPSWLQKPTVHRLHNRTKPSKKHLKAIEPEPDLDHSVEPGQYIDFKSFLGYPFLS
jgi:hypothetical protein